MSAPPSPLQAAELAAADYASAEWFIVLNPGSGPAEAGSKREALEAALAATGRRHRFVTVGPGGMLAACQQAGEAAASARGVLVAAGGDGTLNCAAQAALRNGCPLGVVPQGTFNLFARDHGLPEDPAECVQALHVAVPRPVQVGLVNGRVFLANAAVGLYPKLLEDREEFKEQLGRRRRWIALLSSLYTLAEWRWEMRLDAELDGELKSLRTPSVFVCNNSVQLRRLGIAEEVVEPVGEGRLVAIVAHRLDLGAKLRLAWGAAFSRLGDAGEIDCYSLRSLGVTTRWARRLKVSTDGEVQWMQLPLRFTVSPQPLMLMLPERGS